MQHVDGYAGAGERLGQIDGEHDLRQLALAVGARAAVAARQHDIGEVDRLLAGRGHVNDARRCAPPEQRKQQMGQQEAGQVVDGEAKLVAVRHWSGAQHRQCRCRRC
jgi:hypothetical protein